MISQQNYQTRNDWATVVLYMCVDHNTFASAVSGALVVDIIALLPTKP